MLSRTRARPPRCKAEGYKGASTLKVAQRRPRATVYWGPGVLSGPLSAIRSALRAGSGPRSGRPAGPRWPRPGGRSTGSGRRRRPASMGVGTVAKEFAQDLRMTPPQRVDTSEPPLRDAVTCGDARRGGGPDRVPVNDPLTGHRRSPGMECWSGRPSLSPAAPLDSAVAAPGAAVGGVPTCRQRRKRSGGEGALAAGHSPAPVPWVLI